MLAVPAKRTAIEIPRHKGAKSTPKMDAILEKDCAILRGRSFHRYRVVLTANKLICTPHKSKRNPEVGEFRVNLKDVLISRCSSKLPEIEHRDRAKCIPCGCCKPKPSQIHFEDSSSSAFVTVVHFPYNKPSQDKGVRRKREIIFYFDGNGGHTSAGEFCKKVNNLSSLKNTTPGNDAEPREGGDAPDSGSPARRRKFLVCINPFSGPGHAKQIYTRDVKPVFQEAGIEVEELYTEKKNHARERATQVDISKYDAVVIVSGDGLVFEWLNGIMDRPDRHEAISLPMGIIPAGSGNALASAMLVHKEESPYKCAPLHSALMTAKGRPTPMDVVEVHYGDKVVHSFLAVAWGIISDIDIESEWLRFIGSPRFTLQAFIRIFRLRKYRGWLSYLPAVGYVPKVAPAGNAAADDTTRVLPLEEHLILNSKSVQAGDGVINTGFQGSRKNSEESDAGGRSLEVSGSSGDDSCPTQKSHLSSVTLPRLNEPVPSDWVTLEDKFVCIVVMQDSHLSRDIVAWPGRTFDEGVMCIQYLTYPAPKLELLEIMGQMKDGSHMANSSMKSVYARAFRIEPAENDGILTVDGERVQFGPIQGRMLDLKANILMP